MPKYEAKDIKLPAAKLADIFTIGERRFKIILYCYFEITVE